MGRQLCLLLACLAVAQASRIMAESTSAAARGLLQQAQCPDHCSPGACALDRSSSGFRCTDCTGSMVVNEATGQCGCPPGRYFTAGNCADCPVASFCPGGIHNTKTSTATAVATACGTGLTTRTKRSRVAAACTNLPGYRYVAGTTPSAVLCTSNTYSVGFKKQPSCTPCAPGFVIAAAAGLLPAARDNPNDCVPPAGYYLKSPGQVASCPVGEFKDTEANAATCTPCGTGITTASAASTSPTACTILKPGYYALTYSSSRVQTTKVCPQRYYCPGGSASAAAATVTHTPAAGLRSCTSQYSTTGSALWTKEQGAISASECMLPPGYSYAHSGLVITACTDGYFREAWTAATALSADVACTACASNLLGTGMMSEAVDALATYADSDGAITNTMVKGSSGACALQQGYGLYITGSGASPTYRVQACNANNYGVADKTYGLAAAPCRACPTNMVTNLVAPSVNFRVGGSASAGTAGLPFYGPQACVTLAGYGYDGRVSTQCQIGRYNAGNNYSPCTACGFGLTTAAVGQDAEGDCGIAPGYGFRDGSLQLCAVDAFNAAVQATRTTACGACAGNTGSSEIGAASSGDCDICKDGYGTPDANLNNCADCSILDAYGPRDRTPSNQACIACPVSTVGFTFFCNGQTYPYTSPAVSRSLTSVPSDCVAEWAQIEDHLWFLSGATADHAGNANLAACQTACGATCHFLSYDYAATACYTYEPTVTTAAAIVAYKATPSGDVGASSLKAKSATASGLYTQWGVDAGTKPGAATANAATTKADCFVACDMDAACAAVYMVPSGTFSLSSSGLTTCELLKGTTAPDGADASKRSLTKAVASALASV